MRSYFAGGSRDRQCARCSFIPRARGSSTSCARWRIASRSAPRRHSRFKPPRWLGIGRASSTGAPGRVEASYRKECHVRREAKTRDESYINKSLVRSDARLSKARASDSDIELIRTHSRLFSAYPPSNLRREFLAVAIIRRRWRRQTSILRRWKSL